MKNSTKLRSLLIAAVLFVTGIAATACSGDNNEGASSKSSSEIAPIKVSTTEYAPTKN